MKLIKTCSFPAPVVRNLQWVGLAEFLVEAQGGVHSLAFSSF